MSPLAFKARGGSLFCTWQRCMCHTFPKIHLRYIQHGSQAALIHILVNKHWWNSKLGPYHAAAHSVRPGRCSTD